jgi:hypothetical protein
MWKMLRRRFNTNARAGIAVTICLALLSALLVGCCAAGSGDFNTDALLLRAKITAEGNEQTLVTVAVKKNSTVLLESGDKLTVRAYGETKTIPNTGTTCSPNYGITFGQVESGGFTISLERTGGDVSAPNSTVTLPEPFDVVSPTGDQTVTPQDSLTFAWTQDGVPTDITIKGSCQTSTPTPTTRSIHFGATSSTGASTVSVLDQLLQGTELADGETCTADMTLSRTASGTVDSGFKRGSSIQAVQVRRVGSLSIAAP